MMKGRKINRDETPIRLFKSDFLEFFTHIHPAVIVALWLPVVIYALVWSVVAAQLGAATIVGGVLVGLFLWTLAEYLLHRFVFHFKPRNPWQERVAFLFHGVHHERPQSKTRLVMPPAVSVPFGALFYGLFTLVVGVGLGRPAWVAPLLAGFALGYLTYDLMHYATHHFRARRGYPKMVRQHHWRHHTQGSDRRFGVSSPLWDRVFGT
jgi:sterol desaturase/sphingolipid hydroxylase (fatty acid hydroxylase superfamily)